MNKPRLFAMTTGAVLALSCTTLSAYADTKSAYVVKPRDTVWKIAQAKHLPMTQLIQWNHLKNPSIIHPGDKLWLSSVDHVSGNAETKVPSAPTVRHSPPTTGGHGAPTVSTKATSAQVATPNPVVKPGVDRSAIVDYAKHYMGTPYQWGGESASGFDCSGLVQTVYDHFHVDLPRVAAAQERVGDRVSKSQLLPGDLVFFNTTGETYSHVGIYVGNDSFISATTSRGVTISSLDNPYYWGARFTGATNPLS